MKTAHFDCFSGISGDMTLAALFDAGVNVEIVRQGIASLGLPITLEIEKTRRNGIAATYVHIAAPEEKEHRFLPEIEAILDRGQLTDRQRDLARRIFRRLAEAEATVHGTTVDNVHFHEVGALDSIADIVGAAIGLDLLGVEHFSSRSVPTGSGLVKCAHGMMPVPAPATAVLLKGVPLASSTIKSELTTPTGAAILTSIISEWIDAPRMTIDAIGYGAGRKDFPDQPNLLRLLIGKTEPAGVLSPSTESDRIWVLETNLDNISGEVIGYCFELLFAAGALDVYTIPIHMKKNRPAVILGMLVDDACLDQAEAILFRELPTLGVRRYRVERRKLIRREVTVETPWGPIRGKLAWRGDEKPAFSPEFDDCARIARQFGIPLREIFEQVEKAYLTQRG